MRSLTRLFAPTSLLLLLAQAAPPPEPLIGTWTLSTQTVNGKRTEIEPMTLRIYPQADGLEFAYSVPVNGIHLVSLKFTSVHLDGREGTVQDVRGNKMGTVKITKSSPLEYQVLLQGSTRPKATGKIVISTDEKKPDLRIRDHQRQRHLPRRSSLCASLTRRMNIARRFIHKPRTVWLWKLNFQLHLWVSLLLTLYLIVIGVTGSILVFAAELERVIEGRPWHVPPDTKPLADIGHVLHNIQVAYPGMHILSVFTPTGEEPAFITTLQGRDTHFTVRSAAHTAEVIGERKHIRNWLDSCEISIFTCSSASKAA